MEREPQLEARALYTFAKAEDALALPDNVQLLQRYNCHLSDDYFLEIRSQSDTRERVPGSGSLRYIYLEDSHDASNCRPALSFNLNALTTKSEVDGLLDNLPALDDALGRIPANLTDERALLEQVSAIVRKDQADIALSGTDITQLDEIFQVVISKGATITAKNLSRKSEEGICLAVSSTEIEGSFQHVWPRELFKPAVRITLRKPENENHTVLERTSAGKIETYQELANFMEREARYQKEEGVHRDEEGNIEFITGNGYDKQAIVEAERAMGVRDLRPEYLSEVEQFVDEMLTD